MEICCSPEFTLLKLLVENHLISEGHDEQIGGGREHTTSRLQEEVTSYYVGFKHAFVQ